VNANVAGSLFVGANSIVNTTTHFVGNATVNTAITAAQILINGTTFIANATGLYHGGTINAASHTVGTFFTANSTLVNAVSISTSTNTVTIGTAAYHVSNGNMGIGNSTPAVKLSISSTDAVLLPVGNTGQRPAGNTGFIRYNTDLTTFEGYNGTVWTSVGGGASGGGNDTIFYLNGQTVTTNYSIGSGLNAGSFGPISINSGVTVTVPSGSYWSVV
jgi:hypothetical protein